MALKARRPGDLWVSDFSAALLLERSGVARRVSKRLEDGGSCTSSSSLCAVLRDGDGGGKIMRSALFRVDLLKGVAGGEGDVSIFLRDDWREGDTGGECLVTEERNSTLERVDLPGERGACEGSSMLLAESVDSACEGDASASGFSVTLWAPSDAAAATSSLPADVVNSCPSPLR